MSRRVLLGASLFVAQLLCAGIGWQAEAASAPVFQLSKDTVYANDYFRTGFVDTVTLRNLTQDTLTIDTFYGCYYTCVDNMSTVLAFFSVYPLDNGLRQMGYSIDLPYIGDTSQVNFYSRNAQQHRLAIAPSASVVLTDFLIGAVVQNANSSQQGTQGAPWDTLCATIVLQSLGTTDTLRVVGTARPPATVIAARGPVQVNGTALLTRRFDLKGRLMAGGRLVAELPSGIYLEERFQTLRLDDPQVSTQSRR